MGSLNIYLYSCFLCIYKNTVYLSGIKLLGYVVKRERERDSALSGTAQEDEMGCRETHTNPHYMYRLLLSCNLSHVRFDLVGEMR